MSDIDSKLNIKSLDRNSVKFDVYGKDINNTI